MKNKSEFFIKHFYYIISISLSLVKKVFHKYFTICNICNIYILRDDQNLPNTRTFLCHMSSCFISSQSLTLHKFGSKSPP